MAINRETSLAQRYLFPLESFTALLISALWPPSGWVDVLVPHQGKLHTVPSNSCQMILRIKCN